MHATITARGGQPTHGCHPGCQIQCSQIYNDKDGKYLTSGFEYETIWGLGADCCIEDLDDIAEADHIMDDIGVDSIETAVMFGVAMEAGVLPFGDGKVWCACYATKSARAHRSVVCLAAVPVSSVVFMA